MKKFKLDVILHKEKLLDNGDEVLEQTSHDLLKVIVPDVHHALAELSYFVKDLNPEFQNGDIVEVFIQQEND